MAGERIAKSTDLCHKSKHGILKKPHHLLDRKSKLDQQQLNSAIGRPGREREVLLLERQPGHEDEGIEFD